MSERSEKLPKKKKKSLRKITMIVAASLVGVSIANITSGICAYNAIFPRVERPSYSVYPGLYDYEKIKEALPREKMSFLSGENRLQGYYYPANEPKGLVVIVHGMKAGADDYLPLTEAMVNGGYSVFSYDMTGTYDSEGDSTVGMCQSLIDLDAALSFIASLENLCDMPLFLIGHSWGGYAASSVLSLHPEVKAAALIAPMCNAPQMMVDKAQEHVGPLAYVAKPVFDVYQRILFGDFVEYNGVKGINSTDAPILIAQGVDDTVITMNGQSITAYKDKLTNPNVSYYYGRGAQGSHTGIWHSAESEAYQREIDKEIARLVSENASIEAAAECEKLSSRIDHRLYSEVNRELVELIFKTFEKALNNK
jgi:alpha-beta hydrolase superfamily lysophospholipase